MHANRYANEHMRNEEDQRSVRPFLLTTAHRYNQPSSSATASAAPQLHVKHVNQSHYTQQAKCHLSVGLLLVCTPVAIKH